MSERKRVRLHPSDMFKMHASITDGKRLTAHVLRQYGEEGEAGDCAVNERAEFLAAGANLLVTLEEMEAVAWLESLPSIMRVQNFAPFEIEMVQRIAGAIRAALSPSTPSGSAE